MTTTVERITATQGKTSAAVDIAVWVMRENGMDTTIPDIAIFLDIPEDRVRGATSRLLRSLDVKIDGKNVVTNNTSAPCAQCHEYTATYSVNDGPARRLKIYNHAGPGVIVQMFKSLFPYKTVAVTVEEVTQ